MHPHFLEWLKGKVVKRIKKTFLLTLKNLKPHKPQCENLSRIKKIIYALNELVKSFLDFKVILGKLNVFMDEILLFLDLVLIPKLKQEQFNFLSICKIRFFAL